MATTIVTKNGTGAPTASDLVAGELAVDLTNGRLYTTDLDSGGTVLELGTNPASDVTFGDNTKAIFGAGSDLQIFHDASDSIINDNGTGSLKLQQGGSTKLEVTATGIDVTGTGKMDGLTVEASISSTVSSATGTVGRFINNSNSSDAAIVDIVGGNTSVTSGEAISALYLSDANANGRGRVQYSHQNDSLDLYSAAVPRLNIANNGDISFYEDTGTTAKFFWDASAESLGIGTTSPAEVLNVKTSSGNSYVDVERATQAQGEVGLKISGGTSGADWFVYQPASSDDLRFYKTGDKVTIDSSGNVGIGTSSPASQLDILGSSSRIRLDGSAAAFQILSRNTVDSATNPIIFDADTYTFNRAGSTQAVIDASGNLLVGTTSTSIPNQSSNTGIFLFGGGSINVARSGDECAIFNRLTSDGEIVRIQKDGTTVGSIGSFNSGTEFFLASGDTGIKAIAGIDAVTPSGTAGANRDGFVNLGWTTNRFKDLYLSGNAYADNFIGTNDTDTFIAMTGSNFMRFFTANTERMRIDSSGNLLVGTTSSAGKFTLVSNQYNAMSVQVNADGNVGASWKNGAGSEVGYIQVNTSSTLYSTSSDQRLKDNIVDAPSASDDIDAIQVRSFDWKVNGSHQKYGMVAQELLEVAPSAVSQPEDPEEMMGVDYSKLVPMMLKEIQSLRARVAALES